MDTQTTASTEQIVSLMESGLSLTFSDEQKKILGNDFQRPLLVNACAGSGKTTINILMTLVAMSKGLVEPQEVLGVTFSHKSKVDMGERYNKYVNQLSDVGLTYGQTKPNFTTFHALFYRLLALNENYQGIKVLPSIGRFKRMLMMKIEHPDSVASNSELVDQMFTLNNYLINKDLTEDGIYPTGYEDMSDVEIIDALDQCTRKTHQPGFYQDYFEVMTTYQELKRQNGLIDFNDMKLLLAKSMEDTKYLEQYRNVMSQFKLVVIDEFQDIDNLQWRIISQLLSDDTMSHLIAIGDDDQSIYSFRGSNPKYIMNFHELMPNAQTLNLSTNYRTGGHILSCAVPMIKQNKVRLDKSLQAFNSEKGKLLSYAPVSDSVKDDPLLRNLVHNIKDPNIDNNDIAVLVRYNAARTIAADYLANQNIYSNLNNVGLVLQRNSVYKILISLMHALWEDKFKPFRDQANRIGFKKYGKHIDDLKKRYGKSRIVKLSNYLDIAQDSMTTLGQSPLDEYGQDFDVDVIEAVKRTNLIKSEMADKSDNTTSLCRIAEGLTETYFNYMMENLYISKKEFSKLIDYLHNEMDGYTDPADFFANEDRKERILTDPNQIEKQTAKVQFLSLHQSKGLEFKYVYLYGLTDKELHQDTLLINDLFKPDVSFDEFTKIFKQQVSLNFKKLNGAYSNALISEYSDILHEPFFHITAIDDSLKDKDNMKLFYALYVATKKYSTFTEEERRLLYVGVTRAKLELNVELLSDSNPLLYTLDLPTKRQN